MDDVMDVADTNAKKLVVFAAMKDAGVCYAMFHFDGSGDSGQIESKEFFDAEGVMVTAPESLSGYATHTPGEIMEELLYTATGDYDWVNNDGGFGYVYFFAAKPPATEDNGHVIDAWTALEEEYAEGESWCGIYADIRIRYTETNDYTATL